MAAYPIILPPEYLPSQGELVLPASTTQAGSRLHFVFETWWPDGISGTQAETVGGYGVAQYNHALWGLPGVMMELKVRPYQYDPADPTRFAVVVQQHLDKWASRGHDNEFSWYFDIYGVGGASPASAVEGVDCWEPWFGSELEGAGLPANHVFVDEAAKYNAQFMGDTFEKVRQQLVAAGLPMPSGFYDTSEVANPSNACDLTTCMDHAKAGSSPVWARGSLQELFASMRRSDGQPFASESRARVPYAFLGGTAFQCLVPPNSGSPYSAFAAEDEVCQRSNQALLAVFDQARFKGYLEPLSRVFGDLPVGTYLVNDSGFAQDDTASRRCPTATPTGRLRGTPWQQNGCTFTLQGIAVPNGHGAGGYNNPSYNSDLNYLIGVSDSAYFHNWCVYYRKPADCPQVFKDATMPIPNRPNGVEAFTMGDYYWAAYQSNRERLYAMVRANPGVPKFMFVTLGYFQFSGGDAGQNAAVSACKLWCLKEIMKYAVRLGVRRFLVWEENYAYGALNFAFGGVTKSCQDWWREVVEETTAYAEGIDAQLDDGAAGQPSSQEVLRVTAGLGVDVRIGRGRFRNGLKSSRRRAGGGSR